jgi:hypothetical protein
MMFIGRQGAPQALVRRPSTARYEKLVTELARSQQGLQDGSGDPLVVGGYVLAAVMEFLRSDEAVVHSGITTPLAVILNAVNDCRNGGRPAVLFDQPKSAGRPTNQAFDAVKAAAAVAIDVLLSAKVSRREAGKYVAACAREVGLCRPDGKGIGSRTALGWRDEIETSRSAIGAKVYRQVRAAYEAMEPIHEVGRAKALARDFMQQARSAGFGVYHASQSK